MQLTQATRVARPVSVAVETFGQGRMDKDLLVSLVYRCFNLQPAAINDRLGPRAPVYQQLLASGHFGRTDLDFRGRYRRRRDLTHSGGDAVETQ